MRSETKKVVVVLSSGRAGSSLLMQILAALGLRLSDNLIGPNPRHPDGFFEDADIVELHKGLFNDLGTDARYPPPDGWMASDAAARFREKAYALLASRLSVAKRTWGFKDPRTCAFLPAWMSVFESMSTIPVFVLAVRDPSAMVRSYITQSPRQISSELAERVWLWRTCDALHYTAADCHVVHYEDWFCRPAATADELLRYTGLEGCHGGDVDATLKSIIKPALNRAVHDPHVIGHSSVRQLYDVLKECRGSDFDRTSLMQTVTACRHAMDRFRGER
jgi:hypothetical protein